MFQKYKLLNYVLIFKCTAINIFKAKLSSNLGEVGGGGYRAWNE